MHSLGRGEIKGSTPFFGSNVSKNMQLVSKSDTLLIKLLKVH